MSGTCTPNDENKACTLALETDGAGTRSMRLFHGGVCSLQDCRRVTERVSTWVVVVVVVAQPSCLPTLVRVPQV